MATSLTVRLVLKPIRVWLCPSGPNPWKVVMVLEELSIPYEIVMRKFDDVKKKPFIDLNPNGRFPAIEDPNTDLTLWESGAIVNYLVDQYDSNFSISYDSLKEKNLCNQWLHFQVSGQGPYYGQAGWFHHQHPEVVPSAIERYDAQARRVLAVLDGWLEGRDWLVGDKMTYADISFVPWNDRFDAVVSCHADNKFEGFANVASWHECMTRRHSWKVAMRHRDRGMDEQGLEWNGRPRGIESFQEYEEKIAAGEDTTPPVKQSWNKR
ncbi:glutathione S-transferase [Ustulina deusta]|nr:glutathione S-transferase [Ustulina deusta]